MTQQKPSIAEKYIADVCAGRILTSKFVRLQCERHQRDLIEGPNRELKFDRGRAQHPIEFFKNFLVHPDKSDFAGQPFILEPHQQALIWILYGWTWADTGYRRYKYAYVEQARGQGKSMVASGLCLYDLITTRGAEVFAAATDKGTAKLVWDSAASMVELSPALKKRIKTYRNNLNLPASGGKFEPCSAEDKNLMGLRPTMVCLDELHKHPTSGVWDVFASALGKRKSALLFAITNSGFDRESVCYKKREYSIKVLQGIVPDDTWFAWIAGLDEGDYEDSKWLNEANWIKANPSLGTLVDIDELRQQAKAAAADPSSLNAFLQYRLGVWTSSHSVWMPMEKWDICNDPVDPEALKGRSCFGGLDLSTSIDISSFVLLFPPNGDDDKWRILPFFFLPEDNIEARVKKDRVPYDIWNRQGLFNLTPGNVIDTRFIRNKIVELSAVYKIAEIGYDRAFAADITPQLEESNLAMVPINQGGVSMTSPCKRLLEMVLRGEVAHGGNPVLRWMASNVIVTPAPTGLLRVDKAKAREKIDGISATLNALARGMVATSDSKRTASAIYEERGIRFL